jgi:hypothetical protein
MEYILLGGISFGADQLASPLTYPPLFQALGSVHRSLPGALNGSIYGVGAYMLTSAIQGNSVDSMDIVAITASVMATHMIGGMFYWQVSQQAPGFAPYLGSIYTAVGAIGGLAISELLK